METERVFSNQKKKKPKKVFIGLQKKAFLNEKVKKLRKVFTSLQILVLNEGQMRPEKFVLIKK